MGTVTTTVGRKEWTQIVTLASRIITVVDRGSML